jgi:hypothetical protein
MRYFFDDVIFAILLTVGVAALFFSLVIGLCAVLESYQCAKYETVTGKPTQFTGLACYVQDNGGWYSWTEYKNRLVANGDFSK